MTDVIKTDICVIGGGPGGLTVAMTAAAFGVPVVLVEKARLGGPGVDRGSVPSIALLAAARRAEVPRRGAPFGVMAQRPAVDFARVHAHVEAVTAAIAPAQSKERLTGLGVRVIEGAARFKDARTVAVGADIEITARRFVIATGSSPAIPPIPGLPETPHLTTETIFDLTRCPDHLVVVGASSTGMELAQAFRRLGAEVTVLETGLPLAEYDPECVQIVLEQLAREGIAVRPGVLVLRVESAGGKVRAVVQGAAGEETIEASHLLVATGRSPNIDGLDLDAAGIKSEQGTIVVDKVLRTTNPRVHAIGDVIGGPPSAHLARHQAGIVIRHALFRRSVKPDIAVPQVTYTDPELAHVGLSEDEARARHREIRILRSAYYDNGRAQAERETHGHIKAITDKKGRILGVTIVGARAGELITTWTLAIRQELNVQAIADLVVPSPTFAEVGKNATLSYNVPRLTSPWVRRIIALLRRFG